MPKAARVLSTPPLNAPLLPTIDAVDALSASAALRLRYRFLLIREIAGEPLPPPVRDPRQFPIDYVARAIADGSPLATLIRLREEAADQIELLLSFLDLTDGNADIEEVGGEPTMTEILAAGGWQSPWQLEDDEDGDTGIADLDALLIGEVL